MAKTNLGKVGFLYKGEYSSTTTYTRLDYVTSGGSTFFSKKDGNKGNALPTSTTASNEWWGVLASGMEANAAATTANNAASTANSAASAANTAASNANATIAKLATVATSGSYNDLSNKPSLATVATSGSYNDLSNKPTIGNGTVTIKQGGTSKGSFTMNQTGATEINLSDGVTDEATQSAAGLMSAADKAKLDGIASGAQVNTVTGIKGNAESSYRTGQVNITPANIGLGNVNNTADADKSVKYATSAGSANSATTATSATTAGTCTGNAATATKATQDSAGQQINSTYVKGISISGKKVTITKGDGTTTTQTTQDTVPTVGSGTLTIKDSEGTTLGTFSANATSDSTVTLPAGVKDETVQVKVTAADGSSVSGQKITINGTAYTLDSTGTATATVPFGTEYSVSADAKSGYITPTTQTFTAIQQTTRVVSMTYQVIPLGIYIYDTDGNFTTAANWDTANNSKAVGVAVSTSACKFVMALTDANSGSSCTWGGYGTTVSNIVTTTSNTTAQTDYKGEANTTQIISQLGVSTAVAAEACHSVTFLNGKTGYMGSAGEWQAVLDNKSAIVTALTKCGGSTFQSYYWTSTQCSGTSAWYMHCDSSYLYGSSKSVSYFVRAFCAF